ncbi:peptidoglycan DD-metalloendopeptidase family protein [Leucobacter albus]|uniref:Peptidoglycan DD-metalloendopeptidase family protein n=1 Tax=Leucobacter albus TaxID=272210 RepID=A0ABW3TSB2_9MICO
MLAKAPGLANSINKALGSVDVGEASKKIGQKVAESVGKSLKDQVAKKFADATAAALEKQTNATKRLSDAEHALVKARAQHGTTAAKVTSAEEKLEALRKSVKATTGDLEKAEAALAKAQSDHVGTGRAVADGQNRLAEAKRNATDASKAYTDALAKEQSKSEQALAWMPLANARIDELSNKWRAAGEKISGVGDSLTNNITKPVVIATGAVGTLVSALGFKRLVGIDTARGQFKGLGMDADAVMAQVDRGVTNTALSMAQGASLAVGILATGSVPLEGLEAQIKRVSNVSAAYNVDAEHAAYLLNNILTKNKVTWGDLSQMQQNQIPIVTQLADYYGVAGGEIMKMAQDGAISVEDLNTVLDQNAGAAAEEYAKTWKGVTSNILSNLGKIGAKFLEPSFNIMKEEAAEFLTFLKSEEFSTVAAEMGDRIGKVVRDVSQGLQTLIGWWAGLSDGQKKFIGVSAAVLVALGPVLKVIGGLFKGISSVISAGKVVVGLFTGWKAAAGGAALGSKALTGATAAQTGAMNLAAVAQTASARAQKALNAAWKANPIGLIVTAITLLVGALVWFFTETKLGKAIFAEFTRFLGEAWANISGFFVAAYENVIKPVLDGIAAVVKWVWETIIRPIFSAIGFAAAILGGVIMGLYDVFVKPALDAIGAIFKWLYENVIKPVIDGIKLYIQGWGIILSWLWTSIVKPVLDAIGKAFQWAWNTFIKPAITALWDGLKVLGGWFTWLWQTIVKPVWDGISGIIKNAWERGIKPVIDTLVRVIQSDPKKAFEAARDAIGSAWKGIQELAAKPVRFVVETVFGGLVDAVNGFLPKGMKIPRPSLPKGFRDGGFTPNVGVNTVAGVVHGREFVTRAESTARIERNHPGLLAHMNRTGTLPGYRKGGLVHPMPGAVMTTGWYGYPGHSAVDLAKPQGTPIQAAGAGAVTAQKYHAMYGNMVDINHGGGLSTRYAHMLGNVAVRLGQVVKAGQVIGYEGSTGNSTGPHLHYEVMIGGRQVNPIPYLQGGGVKPAFGIVEGLLDGALSKFKGAFPGGGFFVDAAGSLLRSGVQGAVDWISEKLSFGVGGAGLVPTLYDNGGWLQPGMSLVENKTGRPEPILTAQQWADMRGGRGEIREVNMPLHVTVDSNTDPVLFGMRSGHAMGKAMTGLVV